MAASALVFPKQVDMFPEPAPTRAALTLVDRLDDIECILTTLESLDDSEHSPSFREELERELLSAIAGTRVKIDRTAAVLAALEAAEEAAVSEMKRLAARRDRAARSRERLELYVLATLEASRLKKLDGFTSTLAARNNPPRVEIAEGTELPAEYLRTPPPPPACPDKEAIKAAIKAGAEIAGCRMVQTVRLVRS